MCAPTGSTRCRTSPTTIRPISASRTRTARRRSARSSRRSSAPKSAMSARSSPPSSRPRSPRRRTPPSSSRSITRSLPAVAHSLAAAEPGRAARAAGQPQRHPRRRGRRSGRDRGGLRRAPRMSSASRPGCSASPACRWSRAPRSANTTPQTGRYTLHAGAGGAVSPRRDLALVLGVPPEQARVVMHDVGGNFGTRGGFNPEFAIVAWAARRVGRPVKWTGDRSEYFSSDHQARDLAVTAELALDARRHVSRDARLEPRQPGRLCARLRLPEQGGRDHVEHLPRAGRAFPRPRRADQHRADPPLSQLRPARGHVRHGAADRPGGAADRHRPHRIAPPQPRAGSDDAVHQPVRHGL